MHVIPMIITCMLQGTLCDMGIPRTFYGGNICSVDQKSRQHVLRAYCLNIYILWVQATRHTQDSCPKDPV